MSESPTARRRAQGQALRELREAAGKSAKDAADELECSESKIRKIELGDVPTKRAELDALLRFYEASQEDVDEVKTLAKGANQRGWWQAYRGAVPRWFRRYVGLESAAVEIRTFETELIPGLLQTEAYATAIIEALNPELSDDERDRQVKVRAERQERLLADGQTRLLAVISEGAIRRVVGGPEIMGEQLRFLLKVRRPAQLEVQVVPHEAGAHPATGFPFVLLRFPNDAAPTLAYTESLTSAAYHDRQADVDTYTLTFDRLRAAALSPADSSARIEQAVRELQSD
ncbi:helix-turn-helix domain-containing protein [Saccharopolyspora shandongensis]|uniref:helix-turn-helix domain-containing protein n=1 Tax=Saccharopolyspora shandongensis TaxID=418495 RepID=UPI0033FE16A6